MFNAKKNIIFISGNKIVAATVVLGKNPALENIFQGNWSEANLENLLLQLKKKYSGRFRVLIGEDLSYVLTLDIDKGEKNERQAVEEKIKEFIPDKVEDGYWDFKEFLTTDNKKVIQVFGLVRSFLEFFSQTANKIKLNIDAIESISSSLARETAGEKQAHLILYRGLSPVAVVANSGLVLFSQIMPVKTDDVFFNKILFLTKEKFSSQINKVIISSEEEKVALPQFLNQKIVIEEKKLNPLFSLALKKDLKGEDKDVLNLKLLKINERITEMPKEEKQAEEEIQKEPQATVVDVSLQTPQSNPVVPTENQLPTKTSSNKTLLIIFVIVLLLAGIVVGGILVSRGTLVNKLVKQEVSPSPALPSPSPLASPSLQPIVDRKDLKIKVLNGSGQSGVASKAVKILEDLGYEDVESGNADNYDYEETEIQTNNESYFDLLSRDLADDYNITSQSASLDKTSSFDALIIIGKE